MEARASYGPALLEALAPRISSSADGTPEVDIRPRNVREGDLVLVVDENSPRGCWPLGRVLRVLPGDDGRVRVAEVHTKSGTYIRPFVKLCLLESAK